MGIAAPRPPLNKFEIESKISQYWRVSVVEVTTSTQDDLDAKITSEQGASGDVIAAEFQSAGRGRLDRTFIAPAAASLLFSFFITPKREKDGWSFLPLLAGISLVEALYYFDSKTEFKLKWPNDLQISDKKVSGLITQTCGDGVIIGIGLNVGMNVSELPVNHATSLELNGFPELNRNLILSQFLISFKSNFDRWELGDDFRDLYRNYSATIGREVKISAPGRLVKQATAVDISLLGELILKDGERISVGDVEHLR